MNWTDRRFETGKSAQDFTAALGRLSVTPLRLSHLLGTAAEPMVSYKPAGKWSVKEQVGHLLVMESLWIARLDDFVLGKAVLRPWNGTNADTDAAGFNNQQADSILSAFASIRSAMVAYLCELESRCLEYSAWHERLQCRFSLADHVCFVADHDDHHLKAITQLVGFDPGSPSTTPAL
jgi:hypothetical protein